MIVIYTHLSWFVLLAFLFIASSLSLILTLYFKRSVSLGLMLISINSFTLKLSFLLDWISTSFMRVVLLIRSVVIVYSYNYMSPYSKRNIFLWLTFLFILSMLIVVCTSSLFFLMLGWDGLGLISFFLIVYYQNQSAVTSGLFTLLMNRIGDCFFLVSLGLVVRCSINYTFSYFPFVSSFALSVLLIITFMTKRAIYPFSSWLPLAIAAPTPISALVHSRTLVTAGLYLIMRFRPFFSFFPFLMSLLAVLRIFTSFYAGLNSVFESDLKKLVALSTLSHLGFIGLAFFSGLTSLAFFHLLTHALFKSLLFIALGDILTNLRHSQDIRYLSAGASQTPGSCFVISVSLFNLLGLPALRGFFSKDLLLEAFHYSQFRLFLILILFINVGFTYFYTYQLFFFSFQRVKTSSYALIHEPLLTLHVPLLRLLGLCTLIYSKLFMSVLVANIVFVPLPFAFKIFPLLISFCMLIALYFGASQIRFNTPFLWYFLSKIGALSLISLSVSSFAYSSSFFRSVRTLEQGFANNVMNIYPALALASSLKTFSRLVVSSALKVTYYSLPLLLIFYI